MSPAVPISSNPTSSSTTANLNGDAEVLNQVNGFLEKMNAVPSIQVDLYPTQIPVYCCTRYVLYMYSLCVSLCPHAAKTRVGVASVHHFDILKIPRFAKSFPGNKSSSSPPSPPSPSAPEFMSHSPCFPSRFTWEMFIHQSAKQLTDSLMSHMKCLCYFAEEGSAAGVSETKTPENKPGMNYLDIRWWGLCENKAIPHGSRTVVYSSEKQWVLLTATPADYEIPFQALLTVTNASGERSYFQSLMMEVKNIFFQWPTNRLRKWSVEKTKLAVEAQEHVVGQLVDVLTDSNIWAAGRIIAISREASSPSPSGQGNVTVKLVEPLQLTFPWESMRVETVSLPFGSGRIVPSGVMTKLCSGVQEYGNGGNVKRSHPSPGDSLHGHTTSTQENSSGARHWTVAELPPLLIAFDLEASFVHSANVLTGSSLVDESSHQRSHYLHLIQKRRKIRAAKVQEQKEKQRLLEAEMAQLYSATANTAADSSFDEVSDIPDDVDSDGESSKHIKSKVDESDLPSEGISVPVDDGENRSDTSGNGNGKGNPPRKSSPNGSGLSTLLRSSNHKVIPLNTSTGSGLRVTSKSFSFIDGASLEFPSFLPLLCLILMCSPHRE